MPTRQFNTFGIIGTVLIILVTLALFVGAILTKGLTHDIFLEGAVFLVSVKIIVLTFNNNVIARETQKLLREIHTKLEILKP